MCRPIILEIHSLRNIHYFSSKNDERDEKTGREEDNKRCERGNREREGIEMIASKEINSHDSSSPHSESHVTLQVDSFPILSIHIWLTPFVPSQLLE